MSTVINLSKGENVNLSKADATLKTALIGLGWVTPKVTPAYDLDLTIFPLTAAQVVRSNDEFAFYNRNDLFPVTTAAQFGLRLSADKRDGENKPGEDAEKAVVSLNDLPAEIQTLVFCVSIHEGQQNRQSFGQVQQAFIRIVNNDDQKEIARFDLREEMSTDTAMVFGELYRYNGTDWKFRALQTGFVGSLQDCCTKYGVKAAYNAQ